MSRFALPPFALGLALALPLAAPAPPARAGVIVTHEGKVFVGRLQDKDVNSENLTMHWPYKGKTEVEARRGFLVFPREKVRWYATGEVDKPTKDYWTRFGDLKIDAGFRPKVPKSQVQIPGGPVVADTNMGSVDDKLLSVGLEESEDWTLRAPRDWNVRTVDRITMITKAEPGQHGYAPRIHVFSVPRPKTVKATMASLRDFKKRLAKLTGGVAFEVEQAYQERLTDGGIEQKFVTKSQVSEERVLKAVRKIVIRPQRVYMFAAYVDSRDWEPEIDLIEACLDTFKTSEDKAKKTP